MLREKFKFLEQPPSLTTGFFSKHKFVTHPMLFSCHWNFIQGFKWILPINYSSRIMNASFNMKHWSWIMNNFCIKDLILRASFAVCLFLKSFGEHRIDWVLDYMTGWQHIFVLKEHLKNFSYTKSCLKAGDPWLGLNEKVWDLWQEWEARGDLGLSRVEKEAKVKFSDA